MNESHINLISSVMADEYARPGNPYRHLAYMIYLIKHYEKEERNLEGKKYLSKCLKCLEKADEWLTLAGENHTIRIKKLDVPTELLGKEVDDTGFDTGLNTNAHVD